MKKFAMAAVAAAAMTVGVAQAYTMGTFSNGVVVPNVIHDGGNFTTVVGLINQTATTVPVYWTFFDQDSNHVTDGCFPMTSKDFEPFVWSAKSGLGLEKARGYLVFATGTGTTCAASTVAPFAGGQIAAAAFQVDLANKDVAYTPVIDGPLDLGATADLSTMGPDSLVSAAGAAPVGNLLNMRYYLAGGADTKIAVWSTGNQKGTHTVNIYDDAQNRKSVNFKLDHAELDWFDPATIPGRPANFTDGFIEWTAVSAPGATTPLAGSVFAYSIISAPAFGAVQSILGFHKAP